MPCAKSVLAAYCCQVGLKWLHALLGQLCWLQEHADCSALAACQPVLCSTQVSGVLAVIKQVARHCSQLL